MAINFGPLNGFALNNSASLGDLVWPVVELDIEVIEGTVHTAVNVLDAIFEIDVEFITPDDVFSIDFPNAKFDLDIEFIVPSDTTVEVDAIAPLMELDVELLTPRLELAYDLPLIPLDVELLEPSLNVGSNHQATELLELDLEIPEEGLRWSYFTGQINCPIEQRVQGEAGVLRCWITSDIFDYGSLNCSIEQTIGTFGALNCPMEQVVFEEGSLSCSLEQQIFDPADFGAVSAGDCTKWTAVVTLNSVDVSARLSGIIRVEAEESTQRTAEFTLRPKDNAIKTLVPIVLDDWINKPVTIDYVTLNDDGSTRSQVRLFTGRVDEPVYDPQTRLVTFNCIDNMLVELENMPRATIDNLTPGACWSELVFDTDVDNYEYTRDRMSTIPRALDKDRVGTYRWTEWLAKGTPDFTFGTGDIVDESLSVEIQPGRELVNKIDIDFAYKFDRKRQRKAVFDWFFPSNFCEYLGVGLTGSWTLPNTDMIKEAAEGTGWCLEKLYTQKLPPQQWVNCGSSLVAFLISPTLRDQLALRAKGTLVKRFLQSISENYPLVVQGPTSISAFGEQKDKISQRVVAKADLSNWEGDVECCEVQVNQMSVGGTGVDGWETWEDCDTAPLVEEGNRTDMEKAIETILNQAQTQILETHRQNRVGFDVPIQPNLERYHTIEINTDPVDARGKVFQLVHILDLAAGSAITSVELAISKSGTGVTAQSTLVHPTKPDTTERLVLLSQTPNTISTETHYGGIAYDTNATRIPLNTVSVPDPSSGTAAVGNSIALPGTQPQAAVGGTQGSQECDNAAPPPWLGYVGNKRPADVGSITYSERFVLVADDIEDIDREEEEADASATYNVSIPDDFLALAA